jgi:hypothetical protein
MSGSKARGRGRVGVAYAVDINTAVYAVYNCVCYRRQGTALPRRLRGRRFSRRRTHLLRHVSLHADNNSSIPRLARS